MMKVIISFTSYPQRIGEVYKVVESLWNQTIRADAVLLYLSGDEFPNGESDLPDILRAMIGKRGFQIIWVMGNLKSHKKYYYALQEYRDSVVITVDDDVIYAPSMLSDLMESFRRFPKAVSARRVRMIFRQGAELERYADWDRFPEEYRNMPRKDLCAIGVGGILYPPGAGSDRWFVEEDIIGMAEEQDDLWLKYNEIQEDIPVVYVQPGENDIALEYSQNENLSARNLYHNKNDGCVADLLMAMRNRNWSNCNDWIRELMDRKEYIARKKRYFQQRFSASLECVGNRPVYLYGAGKRAEYILGILNFLELTERITAIIVSDRTGNPASLGNVKVRELKEISKEERFGLIWGVHEAHKEKIINGLRAYDWQCIDLDIQAVGRYVKEFENDMEMC